MLPLALICYVLTAVFCCTGVCSAEAPVIRLHGSTTVMKKILEPVLPALEKITSSTLVLVGNGTGSGLEDLVRGRCDAAMVSAELADAVQIMAEISGLEAPVDLKAHFLANDPIRIIVHLSSPVKQLTLEQLKDLNTGKITNWRKVGGKYIPVVVITSHPGSGTRRAFQKVVMGGEPYVSGALEVETTRNEIDAVELFTEGIGAVSQTFIDLKGNKEKVKVLDTPEIARPLMLITRGDPSPAVGKLIEHLTAGSKKQEGSGR
ncbi:MAG: phosphate ABC transporter substrate-binding protein [Thermodesulfovibrio sp.]|nr:phosphate ABC transporter substrate-binding protein [Thermodesulfovibrio sp.]